MPHNRVRPASGDDLADLHALLEQTASKGINVYAHGEMVPRTAIQCSSVTRAWPVITAARG
jgi:hydroxylamine reductase (hybrid-cluster protein)